MIGVPPTMISEQAFVRPDVQTNEAISCGCSKHLTSALESLTVFLDELTLQFCGSLLDAVI